MPYAQTGRASSPVLPRAIEIGFTGYKVSICFPDITLEARQVPIAFLRPRTLTVEENSFAAFFSQRVMFRIWIPAEDFRAMHGSWTVKAIPTCMHTDITAFSQDNQAGTCSPFPVLSVGPITTFTYLHLPNISGGWSDVVHSPTPIEFANNTWMKPVWTRCPFFHFAQLELASKPKMALESNQSQPWRFPRHRPLPHGPHPKFLGRRNSSPERCHVQPGFAPPPRRASIPRPRSPGFPSNHIAMRPSSKIPLPSLRFTVNENKTPATLQGPPLSAVELLKKHCRPQKRRPLSLLKAAFPKNSALALVSSAKNRDLKKIGKRVLFTGEKKWSSESAPSTVSDTTSMVSSLNEILTE